MLGKDTSGLILRHLPAKDEKMHPKVQEIADHFGVILSHRPFPPTQNYDDLVRFPMYDGKSIATMGANDHDVLHEIGHWVAAEPEQKDLPEFGLGTPFYGTPVGCVAHREDTTFPAVVDVEDAEVQEMMSWFLCVLWGQAYGIPSVLRMHPGYGDTWEMYLDRKLNKERFYTTEQEENFVRRMWIALIRLDQRGLLTPPITE